MYDAGCSFQNPRITQMHRISLYEHESPGLKVSLDLYFNEKNQLILDGYDIGKTVYELRGDADYEYIYTINFTEVQKIADVLGASLDDRNSFLHVIKSRFHGNEAFSKFGEFMRSNGILFEQFYW